MSSSKFNSGSKSHVSGLPYSDDKSTKEGENMTAVHASDFTTRMDVQERRSVRDMAVRASGFTIDELRQQARTNEFETLQAKLSWMVVSAFERPNGEEA